MLKPLAATVATRASSACWSASTAPPTESARDSEEAVGVGRSGCFAQRDDGQMRSVYWTIAFDVLEMTQEARCWYRSPRR